MMTYSETRSNKTTELWIPVFFCIFAIFAECFLIFHDLGVQSFTQRSGASPQIAVFESGTNEVRFRASGTVAWNEIEEHHSLYSQDSIITMAQSSARIQFNDQSEIEVEADSMITFEEAPSLNLGNIVIRLAHGSIKRRKSGATPLFLKLSELKESPVIRLDDQKGNAVFRVVRHQLGVEVIVESGTVLFNEATPISTQSSMKIEGNNLDEIKLLPPPPAPKLKPPKVNVRQKNVTQTRLEKLLDFLEIPSIAAESPQDALEVSIEFEWEESPGGTTYRIQLSKSSDFKDTLLNQVVGGKKYEYHGDIGSQVSELYFRVAAINADGIQGPFSTEEKVTVRPEDYIVARAPTPSPSPLISPTPVFTRVATVVVTPKAKPSPTPIVRVPQAPLVLSNTLPKDDHPTLALLELGYGGNYEYRSFKNDGTPQAASGSGFVPMQLGGVFSVISSKEHYYQFELSYSADAVTPQSLAEIPATKLKVPQADFRAERLNAWNGSYFGFGIYGTTRSQLSFRGSQYTSSTSPAFGAGFQYSASPLLAEPFQWQVDVNPILIGEFGVDARIRLRRRLSDLGTKLSWIQDPGLFLGLDLTTRLSQEESGYGVGLVTGYSLKLFP